MARNSYYRDVLKNVEFNLTVGDFEHPDFLKIGDIRDAYDFKSFWRNFKIVKKAFHEAFWRFLPFLKEQIAGCCAHSKIRILRIFEKQLYVFVLATRPLETAQSFGKLKVFKL